MFWAIRGGGGKLRRRHAVRVPASSRRDGYRRDAGHARDTGCDLAVSSQRPMRPPRSYSTIANVMPRSAASVRARGAPRRTRRPGDACPRGDRMRAGERALAPFRALAIPIADMLRPMSYPEIYPPEDGEFRPMAAGRTLLVDSIDSRRGPETVLTHLRASTAQIAPVARLRVLGGAMAQRAPKMPRAFARRKSRIIVNVAAVLRGTTGGGARPRGVGDRVGRLAPPRRSGCVRSTFSGLRGRAGFATRIQERRGTGLPK